MFENSISVLYEALELNNLLLIKAVKNNNVKKIVELLRHKNLVNDSIKEIYEDKLRMENK